MKRFLLALLLSGVAFGEHLVLGDVTLTAEEAEDLYTQTKQHSNKERGNSQAVTQITTWIENAKPLTNGPEELAVIDQFINVVRQLGIRRQEINWAGQPTPRTTKQKFIDRAVADAQIVVDNAQITLEVLTEPGDEGTQEEIDIATAELTAATTALTAAQAATLDDFVVTP